MFSYKNTVPAILLFSVFFIILSSVSAMAASLWDQLSPQQQNWVFDQAIDSYATYLQGELKVETDPENYIKTQLDEIPDEYWSDRMFKKYGGQFAKEESLKTFYNFAGQISEGNYDAAINKTYEVGANVLATEINDLIIEQLDQLPEEYAPVKTFYERVTGDRKRLERVVTKLMNPSASWSDVRDLVWEETKKDIQDQMTEAGEANLKIAFNYFMGSGSVLGYTPADIYVELFKAEKEFFVHLPEKINQEAGNNFYQLYVEAGGHYDLVRPKLILGAGAMGSGKFPRFAEAYRNFASSYSDEELESLLSYCYKNRFSDFTACKKRYDQQLKNELSDAKKKTLEKITKASQNNQKGVNKFYVEFRKYINKFAREKLKITDEQIQALIDETKADLEKLRSISKESESWCSETEKIYSSLYDMCNKLQTGSEHVDELKKRAIRGLSGCKKIAEKVVTLAEMVELAKERLDKIVRLLQEVDRLRKLGCYFKDPANAEEAKDTLARVKAIELKFKPLVKALDNEHTELEQLLEKMPQMETDIKSRIEDINDETFKELSRKVKRLTYLLKGIEEAQDVSYYDIKQGIERLRILRAQAARASGTWEALMGVKKKKTTPEYKVLYKKIVAKLTPLSGDEKVDEVLLEANKLHDRIELCLYKPMNTLENMAETGLCNEAKIIGFLNNIDRKKIQHLVDDAEIALKECGVLKNVPSAKSLMQSRYIGMILENINVRESLENLVGEYAKCLVRATDNFVVEGMSEDVEFAYVVVKLKGSGYYPHWGGGSHVISGESQFIYMIHRGDEPLPTLEDISKSYRGDVCEMVNPWGFGWVEDTPPQLFDQEMPAVKLESVPYKKSEDIDEELYSNWKSSGSDGPSLYDLKKQKGCE